nr:carbohydrate-binding family 9-like protein [uncultured Dorea sp.]
MEVQLIESEELLDTVEPFEITHLLWGTDQIPKTYGYIGFAKGEGFYLKLVCLEKNPLRIYKKNQDPVYKDSAVEAFLKFYSKDKSKQEVYLNFEMNANGAILAAYGKNKTERMPLKPEAVQKLQCKAEVKEDQWNVSLMIPIEILEDIYGDLELKEGTKFTCNFYKICETVENEHYASYKYVESKNPNFHLPEYFAEAVITTKNKKNK